MSPRARLAIALLSTALTGYIAVGILLGRVLGDTSYGQLSVFNEVVRLVIDAYVEPVNLDRAMAGADLGLTEALDGDSAYLGSEDWKAWQQGASGGDADVGLVLTRRFGFLMAVGARPGSPAEKGGVRTGDILKTIDGKHSRPLSVVVGERLLRGAPGSVVKLKLLRRGSEPVDVSLVRERLAAAEPERRTLPDGTGYLRVREFSARTGEAVRGEVEVLRKSGAQRLVLDLRGAAWGNPAEGAKLAELFLKGGTVAKLVGRKTAEQVLAADAARQAWDLPLAVLVDIGTAGAAEVAAAALLESGRAPVVGERTFGRAALQRGVPLPEGGLVLTVAKYVSPKGKDIHGRGVEPSVAVNAPDEDEKPETEKTDPILDKALELLKAEPAKKAA
jgi:carboxyl-terminal processing protease